MTPEKHAITEPVYFSGGVADPDGGTGYVADGQGVVAVRLADGRSPWRSDRARYPLISDGRRLVAAGAYEPARSVLEVVVLDNGRDGEVIVVSQPLPVPSWVMASADTAGTLRLAARIDGGSLHLQWEAHARYAGGAPPPAEVRRAAVRDDAGAFEIDLGTGAVSPAPADRQAGARVDCRRPPLAPDDTAEAWCVDDVAVRLVWNVEGQQQVLVLERAGDKLAGVADATELARGQGLVAQVTPDGHHLLVHCEPPAGEDRWLVFSAATGRRTATLTHDQCADRPAILAGGVFYQADHRTDTVLRRVLRARDQVTDALLWELALGERPISAPRRLRP